MNCKKTLTASSWEVFLKIANDYDVGDPGQIGYVYRGLAKSTIGLQPSILWKYFKPLQVSEARALELEANALNAFKSNAHHHMSPNSFATTTDTVSWWTVMQHHGAPTRLLDWTESIFVALYFAVIDQSPAERDYDGVVYAIHVYTINSAMKKRYENIEIPVYEAQIEERFLKPGRPPLLLFCKRRNHSDRMIAQRGAFTFCENILGDQGEIIADCDKESDARTVIKIIIPGDQKRHFLRKLHTMNITASTLFPGIDGLARSADELLRLHAKPLLPNNNGSTITISQFVSPPLQP